MKRLTFLSILMLVPFFSLFGIHAAEDTGLQPITPDNAHAMIQLNMLGHGTINDLAWSPDGKTLAVAGSAGVLLFDTGNFDAAPEVLPDITSQAFGIAYSSDGYTLAVSDSDFVYAWNMLARRCQQTIDHKDYTVSIVFLSGEKLAIGKGHSILIWSVTTGEVLEEIPVGMSVSRLALSPDGMMAAVFSNFDPHNLTLWNLTTKQQIAVLSEQTSNKVMDLSFSADGRWLGVGWEYGGVQFWDGITGEELLLSDDPELQYPMAFTSSGESRVVMTTNKTLQIWNLETREVEQVIEFDFPSRKLSMLSFSPDGTLLAGADEANSLYVWNVDTGKLETYLENFLLREGGLSARPDSQVVALSIPSYDARAHRIWLFDLETKQLSRPLFRPDIQFQTSVVYSTDWTLAGVTRYVSDALDHSRTMIEIWDVEKNAPIKLIETGSANLTIFSPDNSLLFTSSGIGNLWGIETGTLTATLKAHPYSILDVAFSPDRTLLATAGIYDTVRLWDVSTGARLGALEELTDAYYIDFDPTGRLLASTHGDGTVRLFDMETREVLKVIPMNNEETRFMDFQPVTFSPDGTMIAAGDMAGHLQIWETTTGKLLVERDTLYVRINSLMFLPDQTQLVAAYDDGTIRFWGVPGD